MNIYPPYTNEWPSDKELTAHVDVTLQRAIATARRIGLKPKSTILSKEASYQNEEIHFDSMTVQSSDAFMPLKIDDAVISHMVCLFFDMTNSTGRKSHTYLSADDLICNQLFLNPITYIALCPKSNGRLAGYRGDGAFFVWPYKTNLNDEPLTKTQAIQNAIRASINMHKCIEKVVNTKLREIKIEPTFAHGGINAGRVLVSRIGISQEVSELTIIGKAADSAAKMAAKTPSRHTFIPDELKKYIPVSKGGKLRFSPRSIAGHSGHLVGDVSVINKADLSYRMYFQK